MLLLLLLQLISSRYTQYICIVFPKEREGEIRGKTTNFDWRYRVL